MTRNDDLRKWRDGLHATFPVVGALRRRWAMDALEQHRNEADVVPLLVEALGATDEPIAQRAYSALRGLTAGPAIDALCALWRRSGTSDWGRSSRQRGYIAQQPLETKILSA